MAPHTAGARALPGRLSLLAGWVRLLCGPAVSPRADENATVSDERVFDETNDLKTPGCTLRSSDCPPLASQYPVEGSMRFRELQMRRPPNEHILSIKTTHFYTKSVSFACTRFRKISPWWHVHWTPYQIL